MKHLLYLFTIMTFQTSLLYGFYDTDMDGIDNLHDICPQSSLDAIVNQYGCATPQHINGYIQLEVTQSLFFQEKNTKHYNVRNFSLSYSLSQWRFTFATNNESLNDNAEEDYYYYLSYSLPSHQFNTQFSIGTKFASLQTKEKETKRKNDFFVIIGESYQYNQKQSFFYYFSYTKSGKTYNPNYTIDYQNIRNHSIGTTYQWTPRSYTELSLSYENALYQNMPDYHAFSWYQSYQLSPIYTLSMEYRRVHSQEESFQKLSLSIGVTFD